MAAKRAFGTRTPDRYDGQPECGGSGRHLVCPSSSFNHQSAAMWKASLIVGLVSVLAYSLFIIVAMIHGGGGSGVWIPLIPLFWLFAALGLWALLRVASLFADTGSLQFVAFVAVISFFLWLFLYAYMGGRTDSWYEYRWLPYAIAPHICSAFLARYFVTKVTSHAESEGGS